MFRKTPLAACLVMLVLIAALGHETYSIRVDKVEIMTPTRISSAWPEILCTAVPKR